MCFATQALLLPIDYRVHSAGTELMLEREILNRDPLHLKADAGFLTGLLGSVGVGHSEQSCDYEWIDVKIGPNILTCQRVEVQIL